MSVTKIDVPLAGLTSHPPVSVEEEIRRRLAAERERLSRQAGLDSKHAKHFHRPIERAFTAAERDRVTILIGALTW